MFHDLGWAESFLILAVILMVFGAGKLSQVGKALGKSVREFHEASRGNTTDVPVGISPVEIVSAGQPIIPQPVVGKVSASGRFGWAKTLFRCHKV